MQGLGLFTLEELHYSPQGVLLTRGPGSYKIPAFGDIPTQLTVSLLRDAPNEKAIFASKVTSLTLQTETSLLSSRAGHFKPTLSLPGGGRASSLPGGICFLRHQRRHQSRQGGVTDDGTL